LAPGKQLDGRYEVLAVIGSGAMGTVYKVRHLALHSIHALKVLSPSLALNAKTRIRFLEEGRIQAGLRHPNVVAVTELVTHEVAGLVLEYVEGPTLDEFLREHSDAIDLASRLRLFCEVLEGVGAAHAQGVVHRDLKPENILVGRDARGAAQAKVTDFGIAKVIAGNRGDSGPKLTQEGALLGTPGYISPEQIRGSSQLDHRTDIFALGAVLYEIVTGQLAFAAATDFEVMTKIAAGDYLPPETVDASLPDWLAAAVRTALAIEPDKRFQSCAAFRDALQAPVTLSSAVRLDDELPVVRVKKKSSSALRLLLVCGALAAIAGAWVALGPQLAKQLFGLSPIARTKIDQAHQRMLLDDSQSLDVAVSLLHDAVQLAPDSAEAEAEQAYALLLLAGHTKTLPIESKACSTSSLTKPLSSDLIGRKNLKNLLESHRRRMRVAQPQTTPTAAMLTTTIPTTTTMSPAHPRMKRCQSRPLQTRRMLGLQTRRMLDLRTWAPWRRGRSKKRLSSSRRGKRR
jgi:hypothetical protein